MSRRTLLLSPFPKKAGWAAGRGLAAPAPLAPSSFLERVFAPRKLSYKGCHHIFLSSEIRDTVLTSQLIKRFAAVSNGWNKAYVRKI